MVMVKEKLDTAEEAIEVQLNKVKIDYPAGSNLNQNSTKLDLVLLDNNYKTLHIPFMCKDYFNEVFATEIDGKKRNVYGFTSSKFPIDILKQDNFKFAIMARNSNANLFVENPYTANIIALLNKVEVARGYELSTIEDTQDAHIKVLTSDIKWTNTPVYFGLYCLLIRMSNMYNLYSVSPSDYIDSYKSIDSSKLIAPSEGMNYNTATDFLKYLVEGGRIAQTWENTIRVYSSLSNCYDLHNNSGPVTYYQINGSNINKIKLDVEEQDKQNTESLEAVIAVEASNA